MPRHQATTRGNDQRRGEVAVRPGDPAPSIFLSPHFDDVALSCGGTVASLAERGFTPTVVTIFAGETLDEATSAFARAKQARWGSSSVDDIVPLRQREEQAAATLLGCRLRWLGLPEAIYRGERYRSNDELFEAAPHPIDIGFIDLIVAEVRSLPEWEPSSVIYVPLGVGGHVDHQLTFAAGQRFAAGGHPVFAYEDCPYAIHTPAGVDRRLAAIEGRVGSVTPVSVEGTLERRIAVIEAYASQVPIIFRFTDDAAGAIRRHARAAGGRTGAAERFWPVR